MEEMETAYSPSSEHAAAVAIELRHHVHKAVEALHVLRNYVYEKVLIYTDGTETEQEW